MTTTTNFSEKLRQTLAPYHLLKHPFYQAWSAGELKRETLQTYAKQYSKHVDAFPRYVSATHSLCDDIGKRQVLLENLIDEERGIENHPELWMQFAEGMGVNRRDMAHEEIYPETRELVDTYMNLSRSSYAEGLAALFAYEYQIPEIAKVKMDGLKKFYAANDDRTLKFFKVHESADIYHSEACEKQLNELSSGEQDLAFKAALHGAQALWNFLSGIQKHTGMVCSA